jgi:hypothetical protein
MGTMVDTAGDPVENFREGITFDAIAAYTNGSYANYTKARKAFPHISRWLEIDVMNLNGIGVGDTGDFETTDIHWQHAGAWAQGRIGAGVHRPVLYFAVSNWHNIMASLGDSHIKREQVRIWTARFDGKCKPHICSSACDSQVSGTADATQWGSSDTEGTLPEIYAGRTIDVSEYSVTFWEGLD